MLASLLGKNAVRIVEFAVQSHEDGMSGLYYIFGKLSEGRKLINDEYENPITEGDD